MKTRVLVIGRMNEDSLRIQEELSKNQTWEVRFVSTSQAAIEQIQSLSVDIVVFNLEQFSSAKVKMATDLRELGYGFPVIVLAENVDDEALGEIAKIPGMVLLEKPFLNKDLKGLAHRLVTGDEVKQRFHKRFETFQVVNVESFRVGGMFQGRIRNLSKGGVYLEYSGAQLRRGDIIRLLIQLDELKTERIMTGQIVWTTPSSPWGGGAGAGVRFIGSGDVYSLLLQGI